MKIIALCHDCQYQHPIDFDPKMGPGSAFGDWIMKHPNHNIDFAGPQRSQKFDIDRMKVDLIEAGIKPVPWLDYVQNADVKIAYAASAAYTCGLATTPLASSATWVLGRESTAMVCPPFLRKMLA